MSGPSPQQTVKTLLNPKFYRTSVMIFPMATVVKQVVRAGFQIIVFPHINERAVFHPHTATGKLKAVMTPTIPTGFQTSIIQWSGLSLGKTFPSMVLDIPVAISHISMNSYTSPSPSDLILPISSDTTAPNASFFSLKATPI